MTNLLDKIKEYINDVAYNVKNEFSLNDNLNLDEIIEDEFEKAFEILEEIIEYIKRKYGIDYKIPELEISRGRHSFAAGYSKSENKIIFFKETIKREINRQLGFLNHKEEIKRLIYEELKSLGYTGSISDIQGRGIEYLYVTRNEIFLYPSYINKGDIIEAIARAFIRFIMFHEIWHSIDNSIMDKLIEDSTIKGRYYLLTILKNRELRASAFQVVMYYLVNGLDKDARGYMAAYVNIPLCRNFIEKIDIMKKGSIKMKLNIPYELGLCYGNIIIAKYKSSLKENIYKIIDDIIYLDEKRAIEAIKYYGDNPDKLLHDKNS
jgi:hypothetical protein